MWYCRARFSDNISRIPFVYLLANGTHPLSLGYDPENRVLTVGVALSITGITEQHLRNAKHTHVH